MSQLAVELSDLRGWSRQVGRAGTDCAGLSSYLSAHVPDGDFGAILELVTHEYEGLIPAFTSVLGEEGGRLLARKWSDPVMWAVALPVIVIDIAVLALMWKRA
jgi:hypothetical protein